MKVRLFEQSRIVYHAFEIYCGIGDIRHDFITAPCMYEAINAACAGIYPDPISADVSPERLKKFFTKEENHFQVKKLIREMVVFAQQNLIKDPPYQAGYAQL